MKQTTTWAAIALMMALMTMACSNDDSSSGESNERKDITQTRSDVELTNACNDFAFKLFRMAEENEKSQILSPISITYALGMLNNGAAGETQKQINDVLGFNDADAINDFCKKMLDEAPTLDKEIKVLIANTIFLNKGYQLMPAFVEKANNYYNASPETRDFHDGKTLDVINQWTSDHTEKMIDKVLDDSSFNPDAVSYLLNAVYFKGAWSEKFDKDDTHEEDFTPLPNKNLMSVPMMHQNNKFLYADTKDYQALCLPYGNKAYRMTILLPHEGKTVSDVLQTLTGKNWKNLPLATTTVDVKIPRFESDTDIDLVDVMKKLGMPNAFDANMAEFPNFCNTSTYIGLMKQVARIKVNEEGTEAAAVTVTGMLASAAPAPPVEFHANRPFLYVISEQSTGAIFFIGKYMGS